MTTPPADPPLYRFLLGWLWQIPPAGCILLVRGYQWFIRPWLGNNCRFTPGCSQYMIDAIQKYGVVRGIVRGIRRIGRCHPWHPGGHDPA